MLQEDCSECLAIYWRAVQRRWVPCRAPQPCYLRVQVHQATAVSAAHVYQSEQDFGWQVLKRINGEIEARRRAGEDLPPAPKTAIAGPEYFGFNQPEARAGRLARSDFLVGRAAGGQPVSAGRGR